MPMSVCACREGAWGKNALGPGTCANALVFPGLPLGSLRSRQPVRLPLCEAHSIIPRGFVKDFLEPCEWSL